MTQEIKNIEMNMEDMENVSGGYIHKKMYSSFVNAYEVINDNNGELVKSFSPSKLEEAQAFCEAHGFSTEFISGPQMRLLKVKGPKINMPIELILKQIDVPQLIGPEQW